MIHVVGGGVAGLAAAYRLSSRGHDVQVFEAGDQVGGLAATYETAGDRIEAFYHHLSKSEETIVDLAHDLGVGHRLEWLVGENAYYVDGVVHPLDTPWEILAYPHLSLYDKFRLGMLTLGVDVREFPPRLDSYDSLEQYEDVPIREFITDHTTRGVYDQFFEPLLDAKFGSRKEDVSAAWLLGRIKFRGERDPLRGEILGYFDGGFAPFIDALVDAVGREHVTTNARVTDLTVENGSVSTLTVEHEGERRTHETDGVVVAAMPNVLEELCGYECDIDFQGAVCAVVTMSEALTDTYWLNIAHDAPFGALIEHTNFVPPARYGGKHLLYIASYIQSPEERLWQASDTEVEELWLSHLEEMFPDFDGDVERFRLARNPRAAPVYERGYLEKVIPYALDTVAEGLYYAGMASRAQYPERSLNGGIVAGFECADRIDARRTDARTTTDDEALADPQDD